MIKTRLWHESLLTKLPQKQICGQWRECLALLGNGFGKKHKIVNYVFHHSDRKLMRYTVLVYNEMINRGYKPDATKPLEALIRRYNCSYKQAQDMFKKSVKESSYIEHNNNYLDECLENLKGKGIEIIM